MKLLDGEKIKELLCYDMGVLVRETTASTNDDAMACGGIVFAMSQTAGRGRMNRKFFSGEGGLYFSICFPLDGELHIAEMTAPFSPSRLTVSAGIGVCKTLIEYGYDASIKWVNDVYVSGKKVCGILAQGAPNKAVVGIGIDLNCKIPEYLSGIAASLHFEGDTEIFAARTINNVLDQIISPDIGFLQENCFTLGKRVIVRGGEGIAVGINGDGALIVDMGGEKISVSYGEAEIKF